MLFIDYCKAIFRKQQFMPTWISIFVNSNYFVRKGIYHGIQKNSHFMKGKMLDFGCGIKPYQSLFQVEQYIGVDIENKGHSNDISKVDFFYDGHTLPFADNSFDSVFTSEVLTHIFNIDEIMLELYRVLKPGGCILVTVPFVWYENETPNDSVRYTFFGVKYLFEKYGFRIEKINKSGSFFLTALQMMIAFLYTHLFPRKVWLKIILTFIFISPLNILGIIFSKLLPKNNEFYQNIILIAKK